MPHIIVDVRVRPEAEIARLSDVVPQAETMLYNLGLRALTQKYHQHGRGGVSLMFVLAETHATFHTYPDERLMLVDIFATDVSPHDVVHMLEELFPCERVRIRDVLDR